MGEYFMISSNNNRKTPYAPTILSNHDVYLRNCSECGRTRFNHTNKDLTLLVEGKGKLPDYLLCGHYPLTIFSEKVLKVFQENDISGYEAYPINLVNKDGIRIESVQYFDIKTTGKAELDFKKMGVKIIKKCRLCGSVEYNKPGWEFGEAIMINETYDGSDLFVFKCFETALVCTKKVLEVVFKNKLTNFEFRGYETMFSLLNLPPKVDLKLLFK